MMTDTYVNIAVIFAVLGHLTFLYYLYLRNHCGYKKVEDGDFICNFVIRGNSSIADVNRIAGQQVCYENDPSFGWGIPAYIELELAFEIDGDKYFKIPQFVL